MDKLGKTKVKIVKPYVTIRPGSGEQIIKGIITVDTEKAKRLIKSGRATKIIPKEQKKPAIDKVTLKTSKKNATSKKSRNR